MRSSHSGGFLRLNLLGCFRRSGRSSRRTLERREHGIVITLASRDVSQRRGALDLLEGEVWVIGVLEPVEAPLAAVLEQLGERVALVAGADTAVSLSSQTAPLGGAAVEDADAAAGDLDVEVVVGEVATGVGRLDDHGLASDGAGGEGQTIWRSESAILLIRE